MKTFRQIIGYSLLWIMLCFVLAGCKHELVEPETPLIPKIQEITAKISDANRLAILVNIQVVNGAEAEIMFGTDSGLNKVTPRFPVSGGFAQIAVLGLRANTSHLLRAVMISPTGHMSESETIQIETPPLPGDIPRITVETKNNPTEGYVLLGIPSPANLDNYYALAIDNDGKVVWLRSFPNPVVDFQKQSNSNFTVWSGFSSDDSHFFELDNLGNIVREFRASPGFTTGPHEIQITKRGYLLFAIEQREMDLTALGGQNNAMVRITNIESNIENITKIWSPLDHFSIDDAADDVDLTAPAVNPWHGNAIEIDSDENLLVSFRNSDEITKIDLETGQILWRLGGEKGEFTFVNDPLGGFSHQHGVRRLKNGNILLFDNGNLHSPPVSRAVEYHLDEATKIAELVWEYRHEPALFGSALGFAQRLDNGNTLINYGTAQKIIEVDQAGMTRWMISIATENAFVYRAFRVASFY